MAGKVLTITSGKGGVGKTTVTANLGVALALHSQRVTVIDADIGLRNLDVMLGLENRIVYDLVDVVEGRCRLRQALVRDKRLQELFLLPAAQTRDKTAVSPQDMVQVCDDLRQSFDFLLIDSPAGIEQGFQNAVAPADGILIVTNPEVAAVRDADRIIGLLEAEEKGPAHLIINRLKPKLVERGDMLDTATVVELLAIQLIGIVPEDESVIAAANTGRPIAFDDGVTGRSFHDIARRLLGENIPFAPLKEPGFFDRLLRIVRPEGG
ncbi:MAG: septum site-determining protein MinD [Anaerolineae bacterium]|nr:septum site-determining protein MinD [Anaerolineae bacterium]